MSLRERLMRRKDQFKKLKPVRYTYGLAAPQQKKSEKAANQHVDVNAEMVIF